MLGLKKRKEVQDNQTFFSEQWREEELIGEGSYGKVYKAKKEEFGIATYSAIKQIQIPQSKAEIYTLKTEGMTQADITNYYEKSVQKWVEEIKFMSIFKGCENIVNIEDYEIIKKKNEIGWIINIRMELLKNLDSYALENNITDKETLKMAIDVATALEECEENNVVHRDIKPDNIFVNRRGIYKVGDFGIAKHIEKTVSNMSKKGTENYMAPELYKNEKGNRTVDIYSLGIMLYRYFNYNRLPFLPEYPEEITMESREEALYKRISGEKMRPPQNASREIAEIILKACNYYPKDRYSSATELKGELKTIYEGITKPRVLFDFNSKQMNKIFLENTKSDAHNSTLSILTGAKNEKVKLEDNIEEVEETVEELKNVEEAEEVLENINEVEEIAKSTEPIEIAEKIESIEKIEKIEPTETVAPAPKAKVVKTAQKAKKEKKPETRKVEKEENKIKGEFGVKVKNHKNKIIAILIAILIFIAAFFIIKFQPKEEEIVEKFAIMPTLVGMQSEMATEELRKIELEIEYEYVETQNEEEVGKVLEQSIKENEQVEKGTVVKLKIAVSTQKIKVISVVGKTVEEAKIELQNIGLIVNVTEQYNEETEQGRVISQMPAEGEEVNKNSTIELLVSLGKEIKEEPKNETSTNKNNTKEPAQTQQTVQTQQPVQPTQPAEPAKPQIVAPTGITLRNTTKYLEYQKTIKCVATVSPDNATNKNVVWSSSNTSIATVAQDGTVKGIAKTGKATITATVEGTNISKSFTITIYRKGDISGDGIIDSADAAIVLEKFKYDNATAEDIIRGDMNGDGLLDSADSAHILNNFRYN